MARRSNRRKWRDLNWKAFFAFIGTGFLVLGIAAVQFLFTGEPGEKDRRRGNECSR
jgi:hypothetical protein